MLFPVFSHQIPGSCELLKMECLLLAHIFLHLCVVRPGADFPSLDCVEGEEKKASGQGPSYAPVDVAEGNKF